MAKPPAPQLALLRCATDADWERWLAEHHADSPGVWLEIAKRGAPTPTVSYPEALETAICFGWIDGQVRTHPTDGDSHFLRRFTPRRPNSKWSQVNRDKALALIASGRMQPAGREQIRLAQADGRWDDAYEAQSQATVPPDFQQALDLHPEASAFFATLTGARRYAFLYRLHHVKTPQARGRRIASYVELLSEGRTLN